MIKDFATKSIKTIKDMAAKLISLLEKFNCTIKDLFTKMGFDADKEEESVNKIADELAKNPEILKKNDAYDFKSETNESFEEYGRYLKQINEDDNQAPNQKNDAEDEIENNGKTVKQADKKGVKQMLWDAFKQFMIWAGVCIVIPGIVCVAFPGTFIALLVPLACKLAWNGYKIVKIYKQWQKVKKEWHTYKKVQKWITVIGMIASIIAICINFGSIINSGSQVLSAFTKTGCNLLEKANLGIQPDTLTRGFAAFVKMISEGKFNMGDFGSAFKEITDSFAQHTELVTEKVVKAVAKVGKSGQELLDEFEAGGFKGSVEAWKKLLKPVGIDPSKLNPKGVYDVIFDGHSDSAEAKKLIKWLTDNGVKVDVSDGFNKGLNKINGLAGSVWGAKIPANVIQKAISDGINLGHNGWYSIVGGAIDSTSAVKTVKNIITAASSMLTTIPSVEYAFQNNGGFRVRLGTDEKKFVYEIGKDGVKKEEAADHIKDVEKITNIIKDTNNSYYKQLKAKLKEEESDKKEEIEKKLKIFQKNFEKINNRADVIIFYGKNVSENEEKNESLSLKEFIINEVKVSSSTISNFIDTIHEILTLICKAYNVKKIEDINPDKLEGKLKDFYNEQIIKWYKEFSNLNKELEKQNIKWCYLDNGNLALDTNISSSDNDKREKYKAIIQGLTQCGHPNSKIIPNFDLLKNTAEKVKQTDSADGKIQKSDTKHEIIPFKPSEVIKSMGVTYEPEKVEKNDNVIAGELPVNEPIKQLPVLNTKQLPVTTTTPEEGKKKYEDDGKLKPVLMIAYNRVIDLSYSDDNGPRKDVFTLKNIDENYEFIEIKGGTSKENISIMLGDILKTQTEYLRGFTILNPCDDEDAEHYKTIGDENTEREDFGKLTNGEITDILNKPKKAKKYIFDNKSNKKVTAAETEKEKKTEEEIAKNTAEKIKNDEEVLKVAKKINPDITDEEGNINDDELNDTAQKFATWRFGHKKNDSKKGFWNKIKSAFKSIFGSDEDNEKYSELDKLIPESLEFKCFDIFEHKSLKDYILEKQNN